VVAARSGKKPLPKALVAIHRLEELRSITSGKDSSLRLGALVTQRDLESSPLIKQHYSALADAAALVGSPSTRYVATLGGNLCNASPAMETGSPLLVFEVSIELASSTGTRILPLMSFFKGPGKTALMPGEVLTAVVVPHLPLLSGSGYIRLQYRQAMEIAVVGAAALLSLDSGGVIRDARLALTAVAPTCFRASAAERVLRDQTPAPKLLADAAAVAAESAVPIDDIRAPALYRRAMVPVIVRRALELALRRAWSKTR
jgi:CO/xanthine dehydrogenase FAD-binding subunit